MHWDHYWDLTKALSSFGDSNSPLGYPEEVLIFWESVVKDKKENKNYLDLGTGKGALALWIQSILTRNNIKGKVSGCDLANIKKAKIISSADEINEAINKVEFKFNTPLELLPYPSNSFDLLVSQFGFEYSKWSESLPEAMRVLKDNGEIILMMHHPDSVITNDCRGGQKILSWFLTEKIFDDLAAIISLKLSGEDLSFNKRNKKIIQKIQSLEIHNDGEQVWFMDIMSQISKLMISLTKESVIALIELKNAVNKQIDRLDDQLSVAFEEQEIKNKIQATQIKSKAIKAERFYVDKALFSWKVTINK
tara:strand:- start:299 stop:1219 length:921 start_codon:yes stop_codon:yes gene_type:complete